MYDPVLQTTVNYLSEHVMELKYMKVECLKRLMRIIF